MTAVRRRWVDVMAASLTTALMILLRWGYSFGHFDQTVLSVRGVALADPHAFRGDWFAQSVPQPHWFFDIVTFVGERLGALPWVYLIYWLAGVVVFAVGAVWLAERYLPERRGAAMLIGPLVVMAPQAVLGSSGPLVWFAVPNMLGGCLAFVALAALLTDRFRLAVLCALVAGVVHVQHGANLAAVMIFAAVMPGGWSRRQRAVLAVTAGVLLGGAQVVATWRHLEPTGAEWLDACRNLIPYHCYAPSWGTPYIISGGLIVVMAAVFVGHARDRLSAALPAVGLPTSVLLVGVAAERFGWGVLGRLAQMYNLHRFVTLIVPFAAVAVLIVAHRLLDTDQTGLRRATAGLVGGGFVLLWSTVTEDPFAPGLIDRPFVLAAGLAVVVTLWTARRSEPTVVRLSRRRAMVRPAAALSAALVPALVVGATSGHFGRVGYDDSNPGVAAALGVGHAVPENGIIAAPPEIFWLRFVSRRAVIADCKAGPYGGQAWHDFMARLDALGTCYGQSRSFRRLAPEQIEALRSEYGATHVLLLGDDPKLSYARTHWRLVYEAPPQARSSSVKHGWFVFEMTPTLEA